MRPKRAGEGNENSPPRASGFFGGLLRNYLFMGGPSSADEIDAALADSPEMEQWDDGAAGERTEPELEEDIVIVGVNNNNANRQENTGEVRESGQQEGKENEEEEDDEGVEGAHQSGKEGTEEGPPAAGQDQHGVDSLPSNLYVKSIAHGRSLVTEYVRPCRIQDLVSESRYVSVDSLAHLVKILVACIHGNLPPRDAGNPPEQTSEASRRGSAAGEGGQC